MPETAIGGAVASDLTNAMVDYNVAPQELDRAGDQKETSWQMDNWSKYLGYYKEIPELKSAIDTKVTWTVGAGFEADETTTMHLDTIKGNGKDSFNSIMKNQQRVKIIGGDSFAEIIRDENGTMINLKPLDPSSIKVFFGRNGRITRYEQVSRVEGEKNKRFAVNEILHLSRDRVADEIHGTSVIPAVEKIILMRNEAMDDWKTVLHRNVWPLWIFHLDTDDDDEIAAIKTKQDNARGKGENMYIPKGVVVPELLSVAPNASLNPLAWINQLNDYFFQVINVPQIIMGNAKEFTDASGKIVYLSYEQSVKAEQLYMEEQILLQLNIEVNYLFPASLQSDAVSDTPSDELGGDDDAETIEEESPQPADENNDTTAELEGKK